MAGAYPHGERSTDRGRDAERPSAIPWSGRRDVLLRVWRQTRDDAIALVAAGVAFYAFLSLFPAITALISLYGLVADPAEASAHVAYLRGTVPPQALDLIRQQMASVAASSDTSLGVGFGISLGVSLYSASKGTGALITALNIVYDENESRGFIRLKLFTLGVTFLAVLYLLLVLALIGLSGLLSYLALPTGLDVAARGLRWVLVLAIMIGGLALAYAFTPDRKRPKMRWVTPGAGVATLVWLLASLAFSLYLGHFGSYNKTYGSAAAIVVLMLWFWISVFVALLGAELNAALEGQTRRDSTAGPRRELGARGAVVADSVRDAPSSTP